MTVADRCDFASSLADGKNGNHTNLSRQAIPVQIKTHVPATKLGVLLNGNLSRVVLACVD